MLIPKFSDYISLKFVPKDVEEHLMNMVKATIKYRVENNIERNDFFNYIYQLSISTSNFTDIDVTAHAASFFLDGFETSSQVMSFLLFELAMNPDAQKKLREEISNSFEKNNKQFSYEFIQDMTYLDACLNESLRKFPPLVVLTKTCTECYTYTSSNPEYKNISVTVEPNTRIVIPVAALQMDPKYFHAPEKYIPERFLDKENISRFAFLPFGEGPRACLGQRFGIMQIKLGVIHLIKNFEIKVNEKTKLPLTFDTWCHPLLAPIGRIWLNFHRI